MTNAVAVREPRPDTRAAAPTTIRGASSASVSYPGFFDELGRLVA